LAVKEILLLGDPRLHQVCPPYGRGNLEHIRSIVTDLHDTLMEFRARAGFGRAIAAPQIAEFGRLVYLHVDRPVALINPVLSQFSGDKMTLWDDCMSFPDLLVKVERHKSCRITFRDMDWQEVSWSLEGALSELLQHECDHLDGILATQRAMDSRSFTLSSNRRFLE